MVSLITLINIRITALIDSDQDGVSVRQYNFHFCDRSCHQFWDDFEMNDKCQTDGMGRHNSHNMNNTKTRNIHGGQNSATYLEALSTSMSPNSQWKKNHLLQRSMGG